MIQAILALCVGALFSQQAAAIGIQADIKAIVPIIEVTSSYPEGYKGQISVTLSDTDSSVESFSFVDNNGSKMHFTPDEVRKGVVLLHAMNKDIIDMVSPKFEEKGGGLIMLNFLRDFFGSDRRKVTFDFVRDPAFSTVQGDWAIVTNDNAGREAFNSIQVRIKSTFGIPSSVDRVYLKQDGKTVRDLNPKNLPQASAGRFVPFRLWQY